MRTNEEIVRDVYAAAEAASLDGSKFASYFSENGYFLDQASGMRWRGQDVRQPVEAISAAFPDMHRQLLQIYSAGDTVVVELKLQGTHRGDLITAGGVLPPTGRTCDVPCCDVFHLKDGKVISFHCYNEFPAWLNSLPDNPEMGR